MSNTNKLTKNGNKNATRKGLKQRMLNYYRSKTIPDLCCEKDYNREVLIGQLFTLYEAMATMNASLGDEVDYLDNLYNDVFFFLSTGSYKIEDKESENISKILTRHMIKKDETGAERVDKNGVIFVLTNVPLYYLLAFLGRTYSTFKKMKDMMDREKLRPYEM
jgi:hypothetical protein